MQILAQLVRLISALNNWVGRTLAWVSLFIVLICFAVVVLRYAFSTGAVWLQDLYVWLNAIMFMGMVGYALLNNAHVRVDIFYRPASLKHKAWVDLVGSLVFILPFVTLLSIYSFSFVQRSWRFMEGSANYGGMPGLYVVKSFLLVFAVLLGLQGIAMLLRSLLVLNNQQDLLPKHLRYQQDN